MKACTVTVVDDVQVLDLPVTSQRGYVHDIEWRRTAGRQARVEWNQRLTVVWPAWSTPLITLFNVRFAWLVSASKAE